MILTTSSTITGDYIRFIHYIDELYRAIAREPTQYKSPQVLNNWSNRNNRPDNNIFNNLIQVPSQNQQNHHRNYNRQMDNRNNYNQFSNNNNNNNPNYQKRPRPNYVNL